MLICLFQVLRMVCIVHFSFFFLTVDMDFDGVGGFGPISMYVWVSICLALEETFQASLASRVSLSRHT